MNNEKHNMSLKRLSRFACDASRSPQTAPPLNSAVNPQYCYYLRLTVQKKKVDDFPSFGYDPPAFEEQA